MKVLSFSVRPELAERLKAEAAAAGISVNQHLRNVLEIRDGAKHNKGHDQRALKRRGFLEEFFG